MQKLKTWVNLEKICYFGRQIREIFRKIYTFRILILYIYILSLYVYILILYLILHFYGASAVPPPPYNPHITLWTAGFNIYSYFPCMASDVWHTRCENISNAERELQNYNYDIIIQSYIYLYM
jgi:hypothetical protein